MELRKKSCGFEKWPCVEAAPLSSPHPTFLDSTLKLNDSLCCFRTETPGGQRGGLAVKAHCALPQNPRLVPSVRVRCLPAPVTCDSRGPYRVPLVPVDTCTHLQNPNIYIIKMISSRKEETSAVISLQNRGFCPENRIKQHLASNSSKRGQGAGSEGPLIGPHWKLASL